MPQLSSGIVDEIGSKILAFGRICDSGGLEKVVEVVKIVWEVAWAERVERWRSALAAAWHVGKRQHNMGGRTQWTQRDAERRRRDAVDAERLRETYGDGA